MKQFDIIVLGGSLLLLVCSGAQARPRDEVMSSAFRCAAIGDSRQWLDCYYGAAQPARAALGLKPAASGQVRLAASPPAGGAPGNVATRDAVMAGAFRCNAAADEHQWLNCYYAAAQPMRAALGLSPAPQAAIAVPHPALPPMPPGVPARPAPIVDRGVSRMESYTFNKNGIFTVTLANGQVWRQVSGDTDHAHWKKPASTYEARVTQGFLGSYNFQVKDNPGKFKVLPVR